MRSQQKSRGKTPIVKFIPVLFVDDDVELCASLKRLLNMAGFNVTAVHDGDSGVRQALDRIFEPFYRVTEGHEHQTS